MTEDFAVAIAWEGEWVADAACADREPPTHDLFFDTRPRAVREAKAICASCPVRVPCLVSALERKEEHGVWGGTTADERQRLLRASA